MKNIIYKPWIGDNYGKTEHGRLLLIGDSHYFLNDETEEAFENFTCDIIKEVGEYYIKFLDNIGSIFDQDNPKIIWKKVAFANAIQTAFRKRDQKPTQEDFDKVKPAILEYMNITKPTKMIVFSKRVWEFGFPSNWGEKIENIEKINSSIWKYEYEGGTCYALGVWHPTYFRFFEQEKIIKEFLNREF